jgi:hypothetical protein
MDKLFARLLAAAAALLIALAIATAAIFFLCGALYMALLAVTSPPRAALATGVAALVVAGLVLLIARLALGEKTRRKTKGAPPREESLARLVGSMLGEDAVGIVRGHPKETVTGSLLVGLAVGMSPKLRAALGDLLREFLRR